MKKKSIEIRLKKGMSEIDFGSSPEKVYSVLGEPQEVENLEMDDDTATIITHYLDKDLALFFVNSQKPCLECVESSNRDTMLFGKQLFLMSECEIINLLYENGYENYEIENEIWGEKRLTFEDAMIDFYFDEKQLSVISWGVLVDENGEISL
ncbi:MAG: hypothetical protein ACOYO1_11950 [Bacteroidales bacterium]